jgi:hypothetical protein
MAAIAETPLAAAPKRFGLGRVVGRTFGAVGGNFFRFFVLAIVLAGGPVVLMGLGFRPSPAVQPENPLSMYTPLYFGGLALNAVCGLVLQAALIHGAVTRFSGGNSSLGGCVAAGLRSFFPILAIVLLMWLAGAISLFGWSMAMSSIYMSGLLNSGATIQTAPFVGLIIFVIFLAPASYFMTAWAVVAPAVVVERAGVFGAFSRSWSLTRTNRWAIFLLGIALAVFVAILFVLSVFLAGAMSATGLDFSSSMAIGWLITTPLGAIVGASGVASVYYELRTLKEGADPSRLAEVFD